MGLSMIILIGSQKGGCGKSTIAVNIAAALALKVKDVFLLDADPQSSSMRWAQDRLDTEVQPHIPHAQASGNIHQTLKDLASKYEYVIADTAGRDSRELRTGMTVADVLISPARPSQYDLDTLPHLAEVYSQAKDLNPKLAGYLVLNLCPTNPVIKEVAAAQEFLADYPEFKLANTLVYDRKAYRDAISEGKSVLEWTDAKAKHEIEALVGEIING